MHMNKTWTEHHAISMGQDPAHHVDLTFTVSVHDSQCNKGPLILQTVQHVAIKLLLETLHQ